MDIALTPELERFVQDQVKAGRFASPGDVLKAGLARLMLDRLPEALDSADLVAIAESESQISRGQDLDWTVTARNLRRQYLGEPCSPGQAKEPR